MPSHKLTVFSAIFVLLSCKSAIDPSTGTTYDKTEAQTAISTANNNINLEYGYIENTEGMGAYTSLQSLDFDRSFSPNAFSASFGARKAGTNDVNTSKADLFNDISSFLLKAAAANANSLDFATLSGVYEYNWDYYTFYKTNAAQSIIYYFPDLINRMNKTRSNNCIYNISALEFAVITIGQTKDTVVTNVSGSFSVDGVKQMDLDYSATYNTSGAITSLNQSATFDPYAVSYSLTRNTSLSASKTIKKNGETILNVSSAKTISSDTVFGGDSYNFQMNVGELIFKASLDLKSFKKNIAAYNLPITDTTITNKYFKATLKTRTNSTTVANIVFRTEKANTCTAGVCQTKTKIVPYFTYNGDTTSTDRLDAKISIFKKFWGM